MRLVPCPAGAGSGEQWVRERFALEVNAYRKRSVRAKTILVVLIDADTLSVQERLSQLDRNLHDAGADPIRPDTEQIGRLVPKRNIETWILRLNNVLVDEGTDYKKTRNDWQQLVRPGIETLYNWTRHKGQPPDDCVPSLRLGVTELKRLDLEAL